MNNESIANKYQDMRVKDLKHILEQLPDDMAVIIPVIDEEDANHIYGFRYVRTAGVLISEGEQDREVLCLNAAADGQDIADQVYFSGRDVGVKEVLFGYSNWDGHTDKDVERLLSLEPSSKLEYLKDCLRKEK